MSGSHGHASKLLPAREIIAMGDASHASGPRLKIVQAKWHHRKQTPLVSSDAHIPERTRAHVASYSVAAKRVWEREESDAQWASNKNDCNASASHFSCQPHRRRTIIYLYIYLEYDIYYCSLHGVRLEKWRGCLFCNHLKLLYISSV